METGLAGARAIVTGGTRGIGLATALALAAEGADVAVCGRTPGDVERTTDAVAELGVRAEGRVLDVRDGATLAGWIDEVATAWGGIDVLVANASAQVSGSDDEAWATAFEADLLHVVRAVRAARPYLAASERAAVVALTTISLESTTTPAVAHAYGSVKAAIASYVGKAATELGPEGIRVNAVSPGPVEFDGGWWARMREVAPPMVAGVEAAASLGRLGTPEDVAAAVVFLAGSCSAWTTGATLRVDGGTSKGIDW